MAHNPEESREKELIEAFIRGDMAGFKFVYTQFRQRVFSYCLYYMGNEALAEDAFQEVFIRVYTRRDQLRETKALKSWLLLITRSVCLNLLRTSKFTPDFISITSYEDSENSAEPVELSVEPNDKLVADDMLKVALSRIAPIYRDAFLLREFEGYDYDEIARLTDTTEMNVKVRITRAKKQLRKLLAPYYQYEASRAGRKRPLLEPLGNLKAGRVSNADDLEDAETSPDSEEVYA